MMSDSDSVSIEAPMIEADLSCMICGYNLRALPPAGQCPECGTDIARSTQGDLLKFADRKWVGSVYRGTCLLTIAGGLLVFCMLAMIAFAFILAATSNPATSNIVATTFVIGLRVCSLATISCAWPPPCGPVAGASRGPR